MTNPNDTPENFSGEDFDENTVAEPDDRLIIGTYNIHGSPHISRVDRDSKRYRDAVEHSAKLSGIVGAQEATAEERQRMLAGLGDTAYDTFPSASSADAAVVIFQIQPAQEWPHPTFRELDLTADQQLRAAGLLMQDAYAAQVTHACMANPQFIENVYSKIAEATAQLAEDYSKTKQPKIGKIDFGDSEPITRPTTYFTEEM